MGITKLANGIPNSIAKRLAMFSAKVTKLVATLPNQKVFEMSTFLDPDLNFMSVIIGAIYPSELVDMARLISELKF